MANNFLQCQGGAPLNECGILLEGAKHTCNLFSCCWPGVYQRTIELLFEQCSRISQAGPGEENMKNVGSVVKPFLVKHDLQLNLRFAPHGNASSNFLHRLTHFGQSLS